MKEEAAQKNDGPLHPDPAGISHPRRSLGLARQSSITTAVRLLRGFTLSQGCRAGRSLGLSCGRFGLSCGRLGLSCGRFGLSCGRLGLSCGRLGLSCGRLGLSCRWRRRRGRVRSRVQRRRRLGLSGGRRAGVVICGWGSWPWGGAVFITFDLGAWRAGQTGFGRLG
jgi:hypothetical protein